MFAFSAFVFHTGTGELTRGGKRLRIPDQEARLLALLLENPGSMVTRDELRDALWPEGEVLDYDRSINRAVSQLRAILRDHSTKSTLLIDTLPKRGYRFAAPVKEIGRQEVFVAPTPPTKSLIESSVAPTEKPAETPEPHPVKATVTSQPEPSPMPSTRKPFWRRHLGVGLVTLTLLATAAAAWFYYANRSTETGPIALGIIPFEVSGESAAPLAESFRLNLADVLSQSPEIEPRAIHSFDHVGQDEAQTLARAQQLGVKALLFGKFTLADNRCNLRLELVRSVDGAHLSSLEYSGTKEELAAISDRVERDIFERLHPNGKALRLSVGRPASTKAYADYLRGRSLLLQWTDDSLMQAIAAFQDALNEDPSYARADAGMASAYFVLAEHGVKQPDESLDKSRQYANEALRLDPMLAEAHAMLGQVALNRDWNFSVAEKELYRAVELDPNHASYRQWLAILYGLEGKYEQALAEIDKAHADEPDWAPLYMTEIFLAGGAHQFDRADRAAKRLLQMMPNWSLAHEQYAIDLWTRGNYLQAIAEWRAAAVLEKNADRIRLEDQGAAAFRTGGVKAYARLRLEAIRTRKGITHEEQDFVPAEWLAYNGDWGQTLTELARMVKNHSPAALQISTVPAYVPLHHDERYLSLIRQIGIPATGNTVEPIPLHRPAR